MWSKNKAETLGTTQGAAEMRFKAAVADAADVSHSAHPLPLPPFWAAASSKI